MGWRCGTSATKSGSFGEDSSSSQGPGSCQDSRSSQSPGSSWVGGVVHPPRSPDHLEKIPSSCQVPGSTTSPIPSIRLRNISSSSRIQDESDPIDPTHQSSSSQGSSSCQGSSSVKVKVQFQFQDPSPFQIPPYESDPIDPTQVLLFSLRFQIPYRTEINCFSLWFNSGIRKSISVVSTTTSSAQKFGPALHRPSSTTYPENSTSPCAELVEAESLVICEEITWRPLFFWSLVDCGLRYKH